MRPAVQVAKAEGTAPLKYPSGLESKGTTPSLGGEIDQMNNHNNPASDLRKSERHQSDTLPVNLFRFDSMVWQKLQYGRSKGRSLTAMSQESTQLKNGTACSLRILEGFWMNRRVESSVFLHCRTIRANPVSRSITSAQLFC